MRWGGAAGGLIALALGLASTPYLIFKQPSMPPGSDRASDAWPVASAELLIDRTGWDPERGKRVYRHENFDALLDLIASAERYLILDFFLWNPWTGAMDANAARRRLAEPLAEALIRKRGEAPDMPMLVLTDPINRIYGDLAPPFFERMRESGVPVVFTDLARLRDSNLIYAPVARAWGGVLGSRAGRWRPFPNPFEPDGRNLSWAQLGKLLYFKANHRKVAVAGPAEGPDRLLVTSMNPADGSSSHSNLGLRVAGPVSTAAARSELSVAAWSIDSGDLNPDAAREAVGAIRERLREPSATGPRGPAGGDGRTAARWLTERAIERALLRELGRAREGWRVDIALFYLSDREVIRAIEGAARRGARVRAVLDANHDAFGRDKNGVPNRPVAAELMRLADSTDLEVRWADTHGEQFHGKALRVRGPERDSLILGSANWTRRNLDNLNLEANLMLAPAGEPGERFDRYFRELWTNHGALDWTLPYEARGETGLARWWKTALYRFQEATGASTF